jgi:hypothetical protein
MARGHRFYKYSGRTYQTVDNFSRRLSPSELPFKIIDPDGVKRREFNPVQGSLSSDAGWVWRCRKISMEKQAGSSASN